MVPRRDDFHNNQLIVSKVELPIELSGEHCQLGSLKREEKMTHSKAAEDRPSI